MGIDLDAIGTFEFSMPVAVETQQSFAVVAQLLLGPAEGTLAFPSLDDVPLTKETFFQVLAAAPTEFAAELETLGAKWIDFYLDEMPSEAGAWEELLTNPSTGEVADFLSTNLDRLVEAVAPDIEFVLSEFGGMQEMKEPATHARLRLKDYDTAHYEDRGWHLCDEWPWFGLDASACTAKQANAEARSLKIPLKAKERRWSEARRAREAATLQHVGARLGLVATGPPAWRLVLDVSGG